MNAGAESPFLQLMQRKVLVVAEEVATRQRVAGVLAGESYAVSAVETAAEALEHYRRHEPDIVLVDLGLAAGAALELCSSLTYCYTGRPATVICLANADAHGLVPALAAGAVDYIVQPLQDFELRARVRLHLNYRLRVAQLEKDLRAKNRQLCTAAHDLRNPLVSIRGLANLLWASALGPLNPQQLDALNTIGVASQSMLDLVNELLDAALLEAGEVTLNPESTSLAELLEATVKVNNAAAAQKGSVIVVAAGELPERITVDPPKVQQVLNNLFCNAIKFSPPGSVITVEKHFNSHHCAISVRDRGPGIRDDEHVKLFKDFSRTSVRPTGGESSTGLGLAICESIMRAHGGTITAQNSPGGGAEFRITFPFNSCS